MSRVVGVVRRHRRASILAGALAVALLVGAVFLWRYLRSYEATDDAQIDGHISPVGARTGAARP
jgi:membrane fusion protein (multidrug efflux system)